METMSHRQVQSIQYTCCMNNFLVCTCYNQGRQNKMDLSSKDCQIKIIYNISILHIIVKCTLYICFENILHILKLIIHIFCLCSSLQQRCILERYANMVTFAVERHSESELLLIGYFYS